MTCLGGSPNVNGCTCDYCRGDRADRRRRQRARALNDRGGGMTDIDVAEVMAEPPDHGLLTFNGDDSWKADAACRGEDVDAFFPEGQGQPASVFRAHTSVARFCDSCTVRAACLNYALANPSLQGWWGGVSPRERRELLRRGKQTA